MPQRCIFNTFFFFVNPCPGGLYEEIRYREVGRIVRIYYKVCTVMHAMPGKKLYYFFFFLKLHLALEIPL